MLMSVSALQMASDWQPHRLGSRSTGLGNGSGQSGLGLGFGRIQTSTLERPQMKNHESFPNSLSSSYATLDNLGPAGQTSPPAGQEDLRTPLPAGESIPETPKQIKVEMIHGGSAPASPFAQISPMPAEAEADERQEEEDDFIGSLDDDDEELSEKPENSQTEKTAEQRRAEKRKMKRFRLAHNQARFLMSEFARQAHPDAAQRERLAKEIPGLSPRQVQVWFQNRRAKLKRLTMDDRERMMKSRALPEDFDMTQALHPPFTGGVPQPYSQGFTPALQPPAYFSPACNEHALLRPPLMMAGLRRGSENDGTISPISVPSNLNTFYTPPGSIATTGSLSPTLSVSGHPHLMGDWQQNPSGRGVDLYPRSASILTGFNPHMPRLHSGHDRLTRARAESLSSPLRISMSYSSDADFAPPSMEETVPASDHNGLQPLRSFPIVAPSMSKPTEFSYLPYSFQSSLLARPRPNLPPGLDLRPNYHRSLFPFSKLAQQTDLQSPNSHPQGATPARIQAHTLSNTQASTPQQHDQPPQSPYRSLAYASTPLVPPHDFRLPRSQNHCGIQYPTMENDAQGYRVGVDSAPSTATVAERSLEPVSYHKPEPETRRITPLQPRDQHQDHEPQQVSPQYQQLVPVQSHQLLHPSQSQQYPSAPVPSRNAGTKGRRDNEDYEDFEGHDRYGSEMAGFSRTGSFTAPTGYNSGQNR